MKLKRAFTVLAAAFLWVFLLSAVGVLIDQNSSSGIGGLLYLLGLLGFVVGITVGFALWASAKGYSPSFGVLLALLGPLGMIILVFLTDQGPETQNAP
jgi:drug/metabolite transporter (DMT)-like permease